MTGFGDRVLDGVGDTFTRAAGPLLPDLVEALVGPVAEVDAKVAPTGRGWSTVYDLDVTDDPRWLGQITGTRVPDGLSVEDGRAFVRALSGFRRGTPAAILAAVTTALAGSKRATLVERDGSPWRVTVYVYTADLPAGGLAAVQAAADTQKPVGIVLTVVERTGATYGHMTAEHGPTYTDEAADFATYADAINHLPEGSTIP